METLPSPPSGDAAYTPTRRPHTGQPRAAISRGLSTRCNTRRRWYASTVKLNSVRTFSRPRMKQEPASHPLFIVPNGCSTSCWRCFSTSGRLRPRCSISSNRCSSAPRVRRRPPLVRVHCCLSRQTSPTSGYAVPVRPWQSATGAARLRKQFGRGRWRKRKDMAL
jgi:hypothetical protein